MSEHAQADDPDNAGVLRMALFAGFAGADTILLHGDREAMRLLAETLAGLAAPGGAPVHLEALPFVSAARGTRLELRAAAGTRRLYRTNDEAALAFCLAQRPDDWEDDAERVRVLARTDSEGHQYLGDAADGHWRLESVERPLQIMASNEPCYAPERFAWPGAT